MPAAWENRAKKKRQSVFDAIPKGWRLKPATLATMQELRNVTQIPRSLMTEDETIITESSAVTILENVHAGVWSAVEVTSAFCHRAAIAHQLVNCLTEILFEDAISHAQELDNFRNTAGGLKGPLHGLPMSFMDRYRIAGAETGAGYIAWLGDQETAQSESLLVQQLKLLGAIPFCKTNLPMSMMIGETSNNIMGSTLNPFVRTLGSGGAAGGEGALLAMRGSPFGWATEIAGSGRIPASFHDLYALKPSAGRLTIKNVASNRPASPLLNGCVAPVCADIASLTHVVKVLLCHSPVRQDPMLLDMPWREAKFRDGQARGSSQSRTPIFAVYRCDQYVRTHPPVQRALSTTVDALRAQGFQVIDWWPPMHEPAVMTLFQILGADGAKGMRETLLKSGEPPVPTLRRWFYEQDTGSLSTTEFWDLCQKRMEYLQLYEDYWNSTADVTQQGLPVDGVILPVAPTAGAEDGKLTYFGYSAIVNLLDYAAGAFPVAFADMELDPKGMPVAPLSDEDRKVRATCECLPGQFCSRKITIALLVEGDAFIECGRYRQPKVGDLFCNIGFLPETLLTSFTDDPAVFDGAPVGLQVMCRRLEEEKVLGLLSTISDALARLPQRTHSRTETR